MVDTTCSNTFFKGRNTWQDNTDTAVLYPTEVKTWVVNIDSRFRDHTQSVSSTDFIIRLPKVYKNIITVRLSSVELPNTWYAFSCKRGDTTMKVSGTLVSISEGNYDDPTTLATTVQTAIRGQTTLSSAHATFEPTTGKMTIDGSGSSLSLEFGSAYNCGPCTSTPPFVSAYTPSNSGLGYLMGFTGSSYTGNTSYTGEYIVDTLRDNYVLLQLPELDMMLDSFTFGSSSIRAFAKIIVDQPKNALIYDNGANTVSKQIQFPQPTNVSTFRVKLVDAYGLPIDLMANFSFTLELQEVVSSKVYEAYRTNLTC